MQIDLAASLGVHKGTISRLEDDDACVSDDTLVRIALVLGLDPDALLLAAGRLPDDVAQFLCNHPDEVAALRARMTRAA